MSSPRLLGNVMALGLARVVGVGCQLLVTLAIVRALGAEAFGLYQYAVTCGLLAAVFSGFGLPIVVTREVAWDAAAGEARCRSALRLQLGLVVVGLGLVALYAQAEPSALARQAVMLAGALMATSPFTQILVARINGYERMGLAALADAGSSGVLLLVAGALLALGAGPLLLLLAWGARELAWLGLALWLGRRHLPRTRAAEPLPGPGETLRASLPFASMVFLNLLHVRLGLLLVRHLSTESALGHYAAAARLVDGLLMLAGLVGTALYPRLASLHRRDSEAMVATLGRVHRALALVGLPLVAVLAVGGPSIARFVFGPGYGPSGVILALLALPVGLFYVYWPSAHALNAAGRERHWLRCLVLMLGVQAVVGCLLIPRYAGAGAALAVAAGEAAALVSVLRAVRRAVPGFAPLEALSRLAPAALGLAATIVVLGRWQPSLALALGLVLYTLLARSTLAEVGAGLRALRAGARPASPRAGPKG